ncbi:hypothetical protein SSBR45G_03710 [Bradyrhizobium sp. SSBR45G]|nr:hypothetical protein SSBR45G_03710 [Bradyrhizobium sp. SSBR45G]GLH82750.1 hypothetical protein SSBR45R_02100 [Bradyrhizobium sp. SSBR45R]
MRCRIVTTTLVVPLVLTSLAVGTAVAMPAARHLASALWNAPDYLPALAQNGQVHFEPGAEEYAREVAALLPAALGRVEAAQGRRFARPVTIGVYATVEKYAVANASGDPGAVGVGAFGRVVLSPTLYESQHQRLPAILTHELSHVHLQGYLSSYAWVRLPNWFKEGLAVTVSDGGDEYVSQREAQRAIDRGQHIDIDDTGSFLNLTEIGFARAPTGITPSHRTVMAYRQAHMFVQFLHDFDNAGFDRMMDAILDNRPFADAVQVGYQDNIQSLWKRFASAAQR